MKTINERRRPKATCLQFTGRTLISEGVLFEKGNDMSLSDPRIVFGVHSVSPYSRTDGTFYGELGVLRRVIDCPHW